jgi:hypothetical protein
MVVRLHDFEAKGKLVQRCWGVGRTNYGLESAGFIQLNFIIQRHCLCKVAYSDISQRLIKADLFLNQDRQLLNFDDLVFIYILTYHSFSSK